MALLIAVIGLAGGIVGTYVGGREARKAQEQQFENQRQAQTQDLRRTTYVRFLRVVEQEYNAERSDEQRINASESEVSIVASPEVRQAATRLAQYAAEGGDPAVFRRLRNALIDAVQDESATG